MPALRSLTAVAFVAGALGLAPGAAAQVKIGGQEVMLSNKSTYQPSLNDLPAPPAIAAPNASPNAAAPKSNGPGGYCNSFTCIPDSASAPDQTITIHGQYDRPSPRAARLGRRPAVKIQSRN